MVELYEKLKCIKKEKNNETRLKRLREVCSDRDILNDALEIAKHESTLNLPGASFMTAVAAIFLIFFTDVYTRSGILIVWIIFILVMVKIEFEGWNKVYYNLIDLRSEIRKESNISKLDTIYGVEIINSRIDALGENVSTKSTKLETIEKEIMSIKDEKKNNFNFAVFLSVTILFLTRAFDFAEFVVKYKSNIFAEDGVKVRIFFIIFILWVVVCWRTFPQEFKDFSEKLRHGKTNLLKYNWRY